MTTPGNVLVVDDDSTIRTVVAAALRREGHRVTTAASLAELRREMRLAVPDVLVTDVVLPDGNGLDFIPTLMGEQPDLPVIVFSAQNTLATAVRATEVGAFDYLPKPFDLDLLSQAVRGALAKARRGEADALDIEMSGAPSLIGRSPAMQEVYRVIARVVANDLPVLITGESGTGKELVAKAIHDLGRRRQAPFVALNMAAIPADLVEAELFGHERGAFTGAVGASSGKFEQADGGTLFLDEIGDMSLKAQAALLRVLQDGTFRRVGGAGLRRADVRIVAATNADLARLVDEGRFRGDLFYRLNVVPIEMPALRTRPGDISLLAQHFLDRAAEDGLPHKQLDKDALAVLEAHVWPGNVRELENLMRRIAALSRDTWIDAAAISRALGEAQYAGAVLATGDPGIEAAVRTRLERIAIEEPHALDNGTLYDRIIGEVERPLIEAMLQRHGQNQLRAARALGINRNTLRKRLDTLGIDMGPTRPDGAE